MPSREAPSYSSSRVQRASRINNIEAARLQQKLHFLEKAKMHQCRVTNQDIRLISLSIDYIQASSGHSPEGRQAEPKHERPVEQQQDEDEDKAAPCFMYGERIWERKKRRFHRPMSAVEASSSRRFSDTASSTVADVDDLQGDQQVPQLQLLQFPKRPSSSPGKHLFQGEGSWMKRRGSFLDSDRNCLTARSASDSGSDPDRLSHISTPRDRVTPRQAWEDDTSDVTKRILKAQALAKSSSGRRSVFQSGNDDVMNSRASRSVRGFVRQIRISATPVSQPEGFDRVPSGHRPGTPFRDGDSAPRKPAKSGSTMGRRATLDEILNQRRPTLSAGAWRSQLKQTVDTPMSLANHKQKMLNIRKELNDIRTEIVNDKVKQFIAGGRGPGRHQSDMG